PTAPLGNLTIANTGASAAVTLASTLKVAGNATISDGIFDLGSNAFSRSTSGGTLTVSNGATLKIGGTSTFPANFTTHTLSSGSTVEYGGTNQTVTSASYSNLTLSGSGTRTMPSA